MHRKVLVPIAEGSEEIEAVCIIDILRRADADVTVASVGEMQVTASRATKLVADQLIGDCTGQTYDCIALPGGMPGAEHLRDCTQLADMLADQAKAGRIYAAICAAPAVVLAHLGLLIDKKATCHPNFVDKLPDSSHADSRVVVDGNCVTSRGPGTAVEFALKLVELLCGSQKAADVAAPMILR